MRGADGRAQFLTEVFPAELEEIASRRQAAATDQPAIEPGPPDTRRGLVGMALSGGGIRSATFGLGVVQALSNGGLLKLVDYLSTVSGGGFVGACLSSTLNSPDTRAEGPDFPLRFDAGREEPAAVVHLRNSGNYLAPAGLLDKFRLAAVLLRGILLNLILFLPYVMLAVALTEIVHELGRSLPPIVRFTPLLALAGFLALVVTFPLVSKLLLRRLTWKGRNVYERLIAMALLVTLGIMALVPILLLIDDAIRLSWEDAKEWIVYEAGNAFETDDPAHWLVPIAVLVALLLTVWAARRATKRRGRFVLYALGVVGPMLLFAVYLTLCVFEIDSPVIRSRTLATFALDGAAGPEALEQRLREALAAAGEPPGGSPSIEPLAPGPGWRLVDEQRQHALLIREDANEHHLRVIHDLVEELDRGWFSDGLREEFVSRGLTIPPAETRQVVGTPDGWWIADSTGGGYRIRRDGDRLTFVDMQADLWDDGDNAFALIGLGLLLFSFLFVNVNQTSSHGFYRDRLSRAYLLGAHKFLFGLVLDAAEQLDANRLPEALASELDKHGLAPGSRYVLHTLEPGRRWRLEIRERAYTLVREGPQIQVFRSLSPNDTLRLSELGREGTAAPYHLINVALNLQGSNDPGLRGRNADFFLFTKRYTGGQRTGFCATDEIEKLRPAARPGHRHGDLGRRGGAQHGRHDDPVPGVHPHPAQHPPRLLAAQPPLGPFGLGLEAAGGPLGRRAAAPAAGGARQAQRPGRLRQPLGRRPPREPRRLRAAAPALPADRRGRRRGRPEPHVWRAGEADAAGAHRSRRRDQDRPRAPAARRARTQRRPLGTRYDPLRPARGRRDRLSALSQGLGHGRRGRRSARIPGPLSGLSPPVDGRAVLLRGTVRGLPLARLPRGRPDGRRAGGTGHRGRR